MSTESDRENASSHVTEEVLQHLTGRFQRAAVDSNDRSILFGWCVFDAFRVEAPVGMPSNSSELSSLATIISSRMPKNRWGRTPMDLLSCLLECVGIHPQSRERIPSDLQPLSTYRDHMAKTTWLSSDLGVADLLMDSCSDSKFREMFDETMSCISFEFCDMLPTLGQLAAYLWRVSASDLDRRWPLPRFPITAPITRASTATDLARLMVVMGLSDAVSVDDDRPIDHFVIQHDQESQSVADRDALVPIKKWLALELRHSFGVIRSPLIELVLGELGSKLPKGVETFGDLVEYTFGAICRKLHLDGQSPDKGLQAML